MHGAVDAVPRADIPVGLATVGPQNSSFQVTRLDFVGVEDPCFLFVHFCWSDSNRVHVVMLPVLLVFVAVALVGPRCGGGVYDVNYKHHYISTVPSFYRTLQQ